MNIFKKEKDYLQSNTLEYYLSDKDFFAIMKSIRGQLGEKGYWLDNYVGKILEAINQHLISDCAEEGFTSFSILRRICTDILDGCDEIEHPIYPAAKQAVQKYKGKYQERETIRALTSAVTFREFSKTAVKVFIEEKSCGVTEKIDNMKQQEWYQAMSVIVGEHQMECLNAEIKRTFLIVPALEAYLQGMTNDYMYCLLHRDRETSRQVFQLLLDEKLDSEEVV